MKRYILTVARANGDLKIPCAPEESFFSALRAAGFTEPETPCGGKGTCHKCRVFVTGGVRSLSTGEAHDAADEELLACRFAPAGDCTLRLRPSAGEMRVVTGGLPAIDGGGEGLGLAVDIGTTTVAAFLYELSTGLRLAEAGARNAQRGCGADVLSRITCCGEGKLPELRDAIRAQLASLARTMCQSRGRELSEIRRVSIAGNTVMEHLFAGLDPTPIGVAPFRPASLFGDAHAAQSCLPGFPPDTPVYLCPCVAGYVGGDVTAGLFAAGGAAAEGLWLYIDIGTNGEMALGNKDGFICCATAAGPAFEGAEITCGMGGSPGAIDRVRAEGGDVSVHVIGDGKALGICGSGLIDAAAAMLELEIVTEAGRLLPAEEVSGPAGARIFPEKGQQAFHLRGGVFVAARDIREVQLAKAAIRAGAETLLEARGKTAADITELVIAGGFGAYLDKYSALRIGLLPRIPPERVRHVGNSAGAGAAMALTPDGRRALEEFTGRCSYLELSSSRAFSGHFMDCMAFDE